MRNNSCNKETIIVKSQIAKNCFFKRFFIMGITKESTILISKSVSTSEIDGEKIMIDFETGKYFMIKGVGNDIWDRIQAEISIDKLISSLLEEYDIDRNTCETEVLEFLKQLNEYGFIEVK